ncbi:MAG: Holliday junction resolvase RuvX [Thermoanaerobaculales bacterium]|jgi:putative Holliday junction resolvase|nr:Holliday junction resolvase RuvX [Thermoanaerobaculales bacterium]
MRVLGIDPGGSRMGLAIGDTVTGVASPLAVIPYPGVEGAATAIAAAAAEHRATLAVIGLPTDADGDETPACARSRRLRDAVASRGLDAILQGEHLTTDEARRRARAAGRRAGDPVDDLAAQVIVEEALARLGVDGGKGGAK